MKNIMLKWLRPVLLTVFIVLFMAGTANTVHAESPEVISEVTLEVTLPLVNSKISEGGSCTVASGSAVGYQLHSITWSDNGGYALDPNSTFDSNANYMMLIQLNALTGYTFTSQTTLSILVDGQEQTNREVNVSPDGRALSIDYHPIPVVLDYITEINLTVPDPSSTPYSYTHITSEENIDYRVNGVWEVYNPTNRVFEAMDESDTFDSDKSYRLSLNIQAEEGYLLEDDGVSVTINEESVEYYGSSYSGQCFYFSLHGKELSHVNIEKSAFPVPMVGQTFSDTEILIPVPEGSKYTIYGQWRDVEDNSSGTFENGKAYLFHYIVYANEGYYLSPDFTVSIDNISYGTNWSGTMGGFSLPYSFYQQITEVTVTGITAPVIGAAPDTSSLQVADPIKYEISSAKWMDEDQGPEIDSMINQFEDGHTYYLLVEVKAKEGYEFARYATLTLGDKTVTSEPFASTVVNMSITYIFKKEISEILLTNVPNVEIGTVSHTDITVPEGASYTAGATWYVWNEVDKFFEQFEGVFEYGKIYQLDVTVSPFAGYYFKDDSAFYVNGTRTKDVDINSRSAFYTKGSAPGSSTIHRVEITVQAPVVGNHSNIEPVVTLPSGANYHISTHYSPNPSWIVGSLSDWYFYHDFFQEGDNYGICIVLTSDEGYAFTDNLTVTVNGITLPTDAVNIYNIKERELIYFFDMKNEDPILPPYYYIDPTIGNKDQTTVTVTGSENDVQVDATVKDSTATIDTPDEKDLEKVLEGENTTGQLVIDLSGLGTKIDSANLPTDIFEAVVKTEKEEANLGLHFSTGSVSLDAGTLAAILDQAEGSKVQLTLKHHTDDSQLNDAQQAAIANKNIFGGVEAYLLCTNANKQISDFRGGIATLRIPFEIPAGHKAEYFSAYHVDEEGNLEKQQTRYENGWLAWNVGHFSDFVIVYEEPTAEVTLDTRYQTLRLQATKAGKSFLKLSWTTPEEADGYVVYGAKCNAHGKTYKVKKLAVIKDGDTSSWTHRNLKSGTYYKYYVKAYKLVDGKKFFLAKSKTIHATTTGGKYGNVHTIDAPKAITLKVGEPYTLEADYNIKTKNVQEHSSIKYESSDKTVAKVVAKTGVITPVSEGTCTIYVYAQNGKYTTVTITVE